MDKKTKDMIIGYYQDFLKGHNQKESKQIWATQSKIFKDFWKKNHVDSTTIKYIGLWKMNSTIPDTVYNHQVANDYRNNMICAVTGAPPPEFVPEKNPLQNIICGRCGESNTSSNNYCFKCKEPITAFSKKKSQSELDVIKTQMKEMQEQMKIMRTNFGRAMMNSEHTQNRIPHEIAEHYHSFKSNAEKMLNLAKMRGATQKEIDEYQRFISKLLM